jgi:polyisoprenoid-binding protein YceI
MRVALLALLLPIAGCGANVQQATIMAPKAEVAGAQVPVAERWVMTSTRSRIDVVGVDIIGAKHPVTFDRWRGFVTVGPPNRVSVEVDMTSARGESELVTRMLKYDLLEVDRFPTATLAGEIDDKGMVEGNATIHGIEKGLRFHGQLTREGAEYHFVARFKISRDVFAIHAQASWDGLVKDDVHIYLDVHARQERVTVEEAPQD